MDLQEITASDKTKDGDCGILLLGEKGRKKPEKAKSTLPLETLVSSLKSGARGVGGLQHRALSRPSKVP